LPSRVAVEVVLSEVSVHPLLRFDSGRDMVRMDHGQVPSAGAPATGIANRLLQRPLQRPEDLLIPAHRS